MSSSPVGLLRKINLMNIRNKSFRVLLLGQNGVGKTALTVRFLTRRFIGEYDPTLERIYACQRCLDGSNVDFEVWDTAGQNENSHLKERIRWADAIILMYDVTDRCSFNECSRLRFLINALSRKRRKKSLMETSRAADGQLPVILVGNKNDRTMDRMVSFEEGEARSVQLNCVGFREISVSETVQEVITVFEELYYHFKSDKRSSLHHHLSASRLTLNTDKMDNCRHSNEDLSHRDAISLPGTPESFVHVMDEMRMNTLTEDESGDAGKSSARNDVSRIYKTGCGSTRSRTLPREICLDYPLDDLWLRSRSKRREAIFMT